mmetsp:Transcript_19616/g.31759  ORF Transcript_19616/g.31759 Transcript_19616/m.31759 type:complete len:184 (-) Transcript_19616:66-617(-)
MTVYPDGGSDVDRSKIGAPPGFGEATPLADSIDDPVQHKASAAGTGTAVDFESDSMVELKQALREGRVLLKEDTKETYMASAVLFKKALMLSRMVGDQVQQRRAVRGQSASKRGVGDRKGAIADLLEVLGISARIENKDGDTDALGTIADLYTELGDLENAGRYYDLYLDALKDEINTQMDSD